MKTVAFVLALTLFHFNSSATGWIFVGPDSIQWRNIVQMDVSFQNVRLPFVGVATTQGICMTSGDTWNYVLRDYYGSFLPPEDVMYRAVYFSPWDDSVGFVGFNVHSSAEPGSLGGRVPNIHLASWGFPCQIGGGYVGYSPSLPFEFSSNRPNHVYSWIIDLYKSTDSGLSWQHQQNSGSYGVLFLSFDQIDDSVLYVGRRLVGQSTFAIYRSTDDGTSWTFVRPLPVTAPYPSQRTTELLVNGDTLVLAANRFPSSADTSCGISVSTDRGTSWSQVLPGVNVQKMTRDQRMPNAWYAAAQGGIYRSMNGGVNWHLYTDSLPSPNLVDIRKDPYSDTLYVATSDLGVYKVFKVAVGVQEEPRTPVLYNLHQNYPNPFNPTTSIAFDLSRRSHATLTVHDLLGREIATLVDDIRDAGRYQVGFQAAHLASGVYLYRLSADGFPQQTRKMVLQK
jgi:hypothetical protein